MSAKKEVLTPTEAAELLMISPITLREWARKNRLPFHSTLGGHRRFYRHDIEEFAKKENIALHKDKPIEKPSLLIVDDDEQLLDFMALFVANEMPECQILKARDGFEAGLTIQDAKPKVILLDMFLPGLSGDGVCRMIRKKPLLKDIKIIGMTGKCTQENIDAFLSAGADVVLEKPIDHKRLLHLLSESL